MVQQSPDETQNLDFKQTLNHLMERVCYSDFSPAFGYTMVNQPTFPDPPMKLIHLVTKKKYKPVALRTKPVIRELPDKFQIIWNIKGDPLQDLPVLLTSVP